MTSDSTSCGQCQTRFQGSERFCGQCGAARPGLGAATDLRAIAIASGEGASSIEPTTGPIHQAEWRETGSAPAIPAPLADPGVRAIAWFVSQVPGTLIYIPGVGWLLTVVASLFTLVLFSRGKDIGAHLMGLRVVRENGDVAGFFHMWARSFASIISGLALGAGYWTALSDPTHRTWHDKWLKTYVVQDSGDYASRRRSSSTGAVVCFFISIVVIVLVVALAPEYFVPVETLPGESDAL